MESGITNEAGVAEVTPGMNRFFPQTRDLENEGYIAKKWFLGTYELNASTVDSTDGVEAGFWLPGPWYLPAQGGFDGRWVQRFDDRPGQEP